MLTDDRRQFNSRSSRENDEVQIDIRCVALVAGRALHVNAVGKNLAFNLLNKNAGAQTSPALSVLHLGKYGAGVKQPESLTSEMGIRREIIRKVALHVRCVRLSCPFNAAKEFRCQCIRIADQEQ